MKKERAYKNLNYIDNRIINPIIYPIMLTVDEILDGCCKTISKNVF